MKKLTHKNHFKFGYNGEYFNFRKSPEDVWNVQYGRCEKNPRDFRTECALAACKIRETTDLPIYVAMSGGVDSEIVMRSFIDVGIPATGLIAHFQGFINEHDIRYAIDFCTSHNVSYKVKSINIFDFWKYELMKYAIKTNCISPQLPVVMWLADQVDGHVVLGSGECYCVKNEELTWDLWEKEKVVSWYRHFMINDKEGTPGFFQYTPELMLSFINDSEILSYMNDETIPSDCSTYYEKNKVNHKHWPLLIKRPIYTGFEKLREWDYNLYRPYLENKFKGHDGIFKTPVDQLRDDLSHIECVKVDEESVMKLHHLYEEEGMTLKRTPYDDVISKKQYYAAYVNGQLAGLTCMDLFKGNTGCYVHGAYTFPKFRGKGVNRELWHYKINDNSHLPNMVIHAINPDWLPDASFQKEMLKRKGFIHTSNRPDGAPVLTCKLGDLK